MDLTAVLMVGDRNSGVLKYLSKIPESPVRISEYFVAREITGY
jgi:hypothetical protein